MPISADLSSVTVLICFFLKMLYSRLMLYFPRATRGPLVFYLRLTSSVELRHRSQDSNHVAFRQTKPGSVPAPGLTSNRTRINLFVGPLAAEQTKRQTCFSLGQETGGKRTMNCVAAPVTESGRRRLCHATSSTTASVPPPLRQFRRHCATSASRQRRQQTAAG